LTYSNNLVYQISTTAGTGNISLTSVTGYQLFASAFPASSASERFYYSIRHITANEYEVGEGYISGGSLVRHTVLASSNSNNLVNFSAGTKEVINDIPASLQEQLVTLSADLAAKVDENAAITGATKTKITYDSKGLVTSGDDATTADIADSSNKRYVTDAQLTVIQNTSGTNTGDQTNITGNAATVTTINGKISAGTNVTLTGTGTGADPYVVNSSGGGAVLSVNGQTGSVSVPADGLTILGAGTPADPFVVNYSGVNENDFLYVASGVLQSIDVITHYEGAIYASAADFRIRWKSNVDKYANWDASGLTGPVTVEFQDASGVMAYLSDIPDVSGYLTSAAAASTYVALGGSYSDPSWIISLAWSKISGAPAFITGVNWGGIGGTLASQSDLQAALDAKASLTGTETLTNKRITPRIGTTTSSATPTINTDDVDMYILTAQAADITSFTTNLSGTPTDGQKLWISITGTAARAITWGSSFESSTVTLPTTTVLTNRLDVGFVWNAVTSKWRCVAKA
jgi:hypothetical protein